MSKLGKKPINIPEGVQIKKEADEILVVGPKGQICQPIPQGIQIEIGNDKVIVKPQEGVEAKDLWGTAWSLIRNALEGVTKGWKKTLQIVGTGYRAEIKEGSLILTLGYAHNIVFSPPEGINFSLEEDRIIIEGTDKQLVGQEAAKIRRARIPDAYHGKGIRYQNEVIKLKPGKAAKTAGV